MQHPALTILIVFLFSLFMGSLAAHALENLRFQKPDIYKENQIIDFIKAQNKTPSTPYHFSPIDLNNDAIDEYIVKPQFLKNCANSPLCPYQIVAFQDHRPILLGVFDAHKILISDKKTYGIRHIIVYNQRYNDFEAATAVWNPFSFQFEFP